MTSHSPSKQKESPYSKDDTTQKSKEKAEISSKMNRAPNEEKKKSIEEISPSVSYERSRQKRRSDYVAEASENETIEDNGSVMDRSRKPAKLVSDPLAIFQYEAPKDESHHYYFSNTIPMNMFYSLLMSNQGHMLGYCAYHHGGFFFIGVYFILNLFAFSSLEHIVFISQFTRAGCSKVIELYSPFVRALGVILVFLVIFTNVYIVQSIAQDAGFMLFLGNDPLLAIRCSDEGPIDKNGITSMCYSILDYDACVEQNIRMGIKDNNCSRPISPTIMYTSSIRAFKNKIDEHIASSGDITISAFSCIFLFVPTIIACFGVRCLSVAQAVLLPIVLLCMTISSVVVCYMGNIGVGLAVLWEKTNLEDFLRMKCLLHMSILVLPMRSARYDIMSISCYLPKSNNSSKTTFRIIMALLVVDLIMFLNDVSIRGALTTQPIPTALSQTSSKDGPSISRILVLEFFASLRDLNWMYYFYTSVNIVMGVGGVLGCYFTVLSALKDHFTDSHNILRRIVYCWLFSLSTAVLCLFSGFMRNQDIYSIQLAYFPTFITPLIVLLTFTLYGKSQTEKDKPDKSRKEKKPDVAQEKEGPDESEEKKEKKEKEDDSLRKKLLEIEVVNAWYQLLTDDWNLDPIKEAFTKYLSSLMFGTLFTILTFSLFYHILDPQYSASTKIVELIGTLLLLTVFAIAFMFDLLMFVTADIPFWRLLFPSTNHPAYISFLFKDMIRRKRKKVEGNGRKQTFSNESV